MVRSFVSGRNKLVFIILLFSALSFGCRAVEAPIAAETTPPPVTEKTSEAAENTAATTEDTTRQLVLCPGLIVDLQKKEVRMDATFCLSQGILEFLVCQMHTFEHESVFATEVKASQLHAALLMIGGEPYMIDWDREWFDKAKQKPGAHLSILALYEFEGEKITRNVNEFINNREREDGVLPDAWTFTGSHFFTDEGKEYYAADSTGALVGIVPKGAPVIQLGRLLGIPYQGDDLGTEISRKYMPQSGTKVQLCFTFKKPAEEAAPQKAESP